MAEPPTGSDEATSQTIDATTLSQSERVEIATSMASSMNEESRIRHDAMLDKLDSDTIEFTTEWHGDSLSEAMGRVYKTRDTIENHTGRSVEVEYTGKAWQFPETMYYEFRLTVSPAGSEGGQ